MSLNDNILNIAHRPVSC